MQLGNCLDKIIGVVMPAAVTAVAIMEKGVGLFALAEPVSGVIVGAATLAAYLYKNNRNECASALIRVRNKLEKELERDFAARGMDTASLSKAFAEIDAVLPEARPSTEELVHLWRLDPDLIAAGMVGKLAARSLVIRDDTLARAIATKMISRSVAAIKDDPDLYAKLQPAVAREILGELQEMKALLRVLVADSSEQKTEVRALRQQVAALSAMWEASMTPAQRKRVEAAGISGDLGPAIARAADLASFGEEAAGLMTGESVEIALELTERDKLSTASKPIRLVVEDIAVLVKAGRLDQAADRANQAISEADDRRLSNENRIELLQRGMDVDLLRFDYDGVAARLEAMIAIEMPMATEEERFAVLLDRQRTWHTRDILESTLSGKAYVALHLALAIARRAETPLQIMQSSVAAACSASALGERLKSSWFGASVVRSVVCNVRTRAMAQLVQAFGQQNPVSAQFIDAVLSYGQQTRDRAAGEQQIAATGLQRWELACFAFPLIDDGLWSRLPAGLLGAVRLVVNQAFLEAAGKVSLPNGFKSFFFSDAEVDRTLSSEYLGRPAVSHQLGMPSGGLFEAFAAHYADGVAVSASPDDFLEKAFTVAADNRSRAAAEVHEWAGRRAFDRFWSSGDISDLNAADVSLDRAASTFDPQHDRARIAELTALRAEVRQILQAQV